MTALLPALAASPARAQQSARGEWTVYGGDAGATKYSPLDGITRENVARLAPAWTWRTGEQPIPRTASTLAARPDPQACREFPASSDFSTQAPTTAPNPEESEP